MVTLKADNRRRVQLPTAKPGEVFIFEDQGEGRFSLTLVKPGPKNGRHPSILEGLKPLTQAEAKAAFGPNEEFDALEHHCASLPARLPDDE